MFGMPNAKYLAFSTPDGSAFTISTIPSLNIKFLGSLQGRLKS